MKVAGVEVESEEEELSDDGSETAEIAAFRSWQRSQGQSYQKPRGPRPSRDVPKNPVVDAAAGNGKPKRKRKVFCKVCESSEHFSWKCPGYERMRGIYRSEQADKNKMVQVKENGPQ